MKFLVQTINGKYVHDFTWILTQCQEFYKWKREDEEFEIRPWEGLDFNAITFPSLDLYIPVGTVEFVKAFTETFYPECKKGMIPLNIPDELMRFTGRMVVNIRDNVDGIKWYLEEPCFDNGVYRKSLYTIKDPTNGFIEPTTEDYHKDYHPVVGYQISEPIDIHSEWRVIVHKNEVQHIACYSGDPLCMPDPSEIKFMVDTYGYKNHAPVAYTLDVAVNSEGTYIIECHRFFSCGLYGYQDLYKLPKMLSQAWFEIKNLK